MSPILTPIRLPRPEETSYREERRVFDRLVAEAKVRRKKGAATIRWMFRFGWLRTGAIKHRPGESSREKEA